MAVNYVQFYRGSLKSYEVATKNRDTLYFITDSDTNRSYLYVGEKLICGNVTDLDSLHDISFSELGEGHLLAYDKIQEKWVNKSVLDAIGLMAGATATEQGANGLVPAPGAGMQDAFLRGDGTWQKVSVSEGVALIADEQSVSLNDKTITLKDFGKKYYKFIPAEGSVEAHYEAQLVDATHPWAAGLEPKVVEENGELILGWFEPNPTTLDGINSNITGLQSQVDNLNSEITVVKSSVGNIADLLNQKANIADVYTKTETQEKINEAVSSASHLKRKTFNTLVEAEQFAASISNGS